MRDTLAEGVVLGKTSAAQTSAGTGQSLSSAQGRMLVDIPALLLVSAGGKMAFHLTQYYKVKIVEVRTLDRERARLPVLWMVGGTVTVWLWVFGWFL